MSEDYEDDEDEEAETEKTVTLPRSRIRSLEKKAKNFDATAKERDEARQQLAIYESGLTTLSAKQRAALLKIHEGEFTADALKETAKELGFWSEPDDTEETEEDAGAVRRMSEASAGAAPAGPQNERQRILEELDPDKLSEDQFWDKAKSLGVAK